MPTVPSPSRSEASLSELHGRSVANSPPSARTSADPLKPALAQVPSVSRDKTTSFLNLVEALSDIDMKRVSENDGELAIRIGGREVYRSASGLLGNQESRVHSFAIGHLPPIFCVDLKVNPAADLVFTIAPEMQFKHSVETQGLPWIHFKRIRAISNSAVCRSMYACSASARREAAGEV